MTPRPSLGATMLEENRCGFLVWAPRANQVEVQVIEPLERTITMTPTGSGYFYAIVEGIVPGALYWYRLDGSKQRPDPASRYQPRGVHGPPGHGQSIRME